jgi:two-component system chemotaxis sensor kinase CheA
MDDLLREFLTETNEGLAKLDQELIELEQRPNDTNLLGSIFRIVHTIKGTCGFIGLPRLEKVAHAGENILGKFRDGELVVTPDAVTLILEAIDQIKYLLAEIEMNQTEPAGNDTDLIARLNRWAAGDFSGAATAAPAPPPVAATPAPSAEKKEVAQDSADLEALFAATPGPSMSPMDVAPAAAPAASPPAVTAKPAMPAAADDHKGPSVADQSIRIDVGVLEDLMNTVSELVLTRNQLLQILRAQKETEFAAPLQRLNLVTSELQEGVMKTRMQPIGNAWQKLPRIIRDLAKELGKKIDLVMLGQETELDRQVLELIKDPLTHMVRNSADHGLEKPADRAAAGKPETGTITLSAFHEGGHIIIEIKDDGRGLNIDRIKQKAIENNLATEAEVNAMTDQQVCKFIFAAGFSTAAAVTSVSGRGVGMDVVRTNIERIGGTIDLQTAKGKGSVFTIKIPLTLAIVQALIVECGGEKFAMPQLAVTELVRISARSEHKVENINDTPVLRLRNRLLPLVSLRKELRLGDDAEVENRFVIVTQVGSKNFGIIVDRVFDTEEIVVKPVAPVLRSIGIFSGNTILGDGSVIMILDPNGIANTAGDGAGVSAVVAATTQNTVRSSHDKVALLLFRAGGTAPRAVPLSLVARLEEIEMDTVEFSNDAPVVQYRGHLMPLIPLATNTGLPTTGLKPVLVFADRDRTMGLVVDEILDIIEERLQVELTGDRPGVLGSAIIAGKATDVLDAGHYLSIAHKDWFNVQGDGAFDDADKTVRVLLVDDSPFFRNLLTPLLSVSGYVVTTCESPREALALMERTDVFDLIVSDIEMPGMSGFDFAEAVRAVPAWASIPMIALSSHATPKDLERGRAAGFTDYVAKFDREALLSALQQVLNQRVGVLTASSVRAEVTE